MDADLQDPPEMLPEMIKILENEDYDCVGTRRTTRAGEPPIRSFFARMFYKIINKISDTEIVDGAHDEGGRFLVGQLDDVAGLGAVAVEEDGLDGGGAPRAVAPEQRDDLAGRDAHRHAVQDVALAVVGVEVVDFQHGEDAQWPWASTEPR